MDRTTCQLLCWTNQANVLMASHQTVTPIPLIVSEVSIFHRQGRREMLSASTDILLTHSHLPLFSQVVCIPAFFTAFLQSTPSHTSALLLPLQGGARGRFLLGFWLRHLYLPLTHFLASHPLLTMSHAHQSPGHRPLSLSHLPAPDPKAVLSEKDR